MNYDEKWKLNYYRLPSKVSLGVETEPTSHKLLFLYLVSGLTALSDFVRSIETNDSVLVDFNFTTELNKPPSNAVNFYLHEMEPS
jgi:hypothetical protein